MQQGQEEANKIGGGGGGNALELSSLAVCVTSPFPARATPLPLLSAHAARGDATQGNAGSESQRSGKTQRSGTEFQHGGSSPTSCTTQNSGAREADASVAFWALTHASFPTAALKIVKEKLFKVTREGTRPISHASFPTAALKIVKGKLFKVTREGTRPISHRKFKLIEHEAQAARAAFCDAALDPSKHPTKALKPNVRGIDFSPGKKYTSSACEELEIDCLLKVPKPASCQWTRDPAQPLSCAPIRLAPQTFHELPESGAAAAVEGASAADAGSGGATAAPASATRSRFSSDMYVVGEVYAPMDSDGGRVAAQKLLQAERVLRFLCAKEGKGTGECVLGMVFLGPTMGSEQSVSLFLALQHYKDILPCLWELHGLARLLCCRVKAFEPAVELMRLADTMARDKAETHALHELLREQLEQQRELLQQILNRPGLGFCCSLM